MDTVILTWNFANWLTVILMALLGWILLALITKFAYIKKDAEYAN